MPDHLAPTAFSLLTPPYRSLTPLPRPEDLSILGPTVKGKALIWNVGRGRAGTDAETAASRVGGLSLIVILPPIESLRAQPHLLDLLDSCRPQTVLPFHPFPAPEELATLLARPPLDVAGEILDYLSWRGLRLSGDTRHLVRKTLDLSGDLRTIGGLARSLFISRRALGRRFLVEGLPVPSHWLQFGRLFRVTNQLQNGTDSLFSIATQHGYADGFALSNQMYRLTGVRPSTVRECLGWEWFVESWLETEVSEGGFILPPTLPQSILLELRRRPVPGQPSHPPDAAVAERRRT